MAQFYLYTTTDEKLLLDDAMIRLYRLRGQKYIDITQTGIHRKAVEMLCLLIQMKDEFVRYDDLIAKINHCTEKKLSEWAGNLRQLFQDTRIDSRVILNKSKVGYRFVGKVEPLDNHPFQPGVEGVEKPLNWLDKFWEPYLTHKQTTFVYTESTFFRSPDIRVLIRHTDVNRRKPEDIPQRLNPITEAMTPCWAYVPLGEMNLLFSASNWLSSHQVALTYRASHQIPYWTSLTGTDVIITGGIRANWMLRELPSDLPDEHKNFDFEAQDYHIDNHHPREREERTYADIIPLGGSGGTIYALVNRLQTLDGHCLTAFSASHSRSFEGVWDFLKSKDKCDKLVREGFIRDGKFPMRFQLLFAVKIDREEQYAGVTECKGWRVLA